MTYESFFTDHRRRIEAIYNASGAAAWLVGLEEFARAAWQGVSRSTQDDPREISQLLEALRTEDLALALACAQGNARAWDTFCAQYRSVLYDAAYTFMREETRARDLADSLLGELFGVEACAPDRSSLFRHFHGRSSLKTWLRAVLYQKFVNEFRRERRLEPLPDDLPVASAPGGAVSEHDDQRYAACLSAAVEAALAELSSPERLLLSYYYVQGLTLKQVGRLSGEHEATASRHLESLRKKLRKRIEGYLRRVSKLSAFEVDRCLDFAARGVTVDLEKALRPE